MQQWDDHGHAWLCLHTGNGKEADQALIDEYQREASRTE